MKIAICDDIDKFREMITKVIRESKLYADAEIWEYADGEDIVNDYEAGKFDVIFMDYYMERMRGDQATNLIFRIDKRVSIIIASTQNAMLLDAGSILTHISKPFGQDVFEQVMEMHRRKMNKYKGQFMEVFSEGMKNIVISENVMYIDKKNSEIQTTNGSIKNIDSLPDFGLEKTFELANGNIINLGYITQIKWKEVILSPFLLTIPLSIKEWFRLRKEYKG